MESKPTNSDYRSYGKIWGLKELEKMGFPVPPYQIIDFVKDHPSEPEEYVLRKIELANIPNKPGDAIGVTIRVSLPGSVDKSAHHGGLHVTCQNDALKQVLEKYKQYGPESKIIIQHTVDAKCSGAIVKENDYAILECIFGDAPPLLEGTTNNYEKWKIYLRTQNWKKEKNYILDSKKTSILTDEDLSDFSKLIERLHSFTYVEWSISKDSKFYFYEYCQFKS